MRIQFFLLTLIGIILLGQAAAVTLSELQDIYYFSEVGTEEFTPLATEFLTETQDLKEIDNALTWWKDMDYNAAHEFVDAAIVDYPSDMRYKYMAISFLEAPLQKLQAARDLVAENTEFAGGYKALINTYLFDFEASELQDFYTESYSMLQEDLFYFLQYGYDFPEEEYSRLALVYYHILIGDIHSAQTYLSIALDNEETWMDDLNLYGFFTRENSLELLKFHIGYLRQMEDGYYTYQANYYADDLMYYFLEEAKDYTACIEFFGTEPFTWSQDIQIGLVRAYRETGQQAPAITILTQDNDFNKAREFQDYWMDSSVVELDVYCESILSESADPLHVYLLARLLDDNESKLKQARSLVKSSPRLEYGYHLATEYYFNELANANAKDEKYKELQSMLKKDMQLLSNYYKRFPESEEAEIAAFIYRLKKKDSSGVLKIYVKLLDHGGNEEGIKVFDKLVLDFDNAPLLVKMTELHARHEAEKYSMDADKTADFAIIYYYEALYNNDYFDLMVEEATKHPDWQELPDVLYLLSNAYYMRGEYTNTIACIHRLVEKGVLGSTFLNYVDAEELLEHPDWQALLDFAATMPDPDAEINSGEEELTDELPSEDM